MAKKVGIEVSLAIGEVVKLANADVIAAYPITPQTHIVEHLAELVADGELDANYIPVESEHSAMSACLGASAAGARTFTATAGQGLELMHEVLYVASSMRLPVVMAVANRAISAPLSVAGAFLRSRLGAMGPEPIWSSSSVAAESRTHTGCAERGLATGEPR